MCILRGMLGAPRPARLCLSLLCVALACAGGQQDSISGNPFTTQPTNTTPGTGTTEPGSGTDTDDPTSGTGGMSATTTTTTTNGPTSDPSGDPSGPSSSTTMPDPDCVDADGDLHGENCAAGADCDDNNFNAYTMCDTCVDADGDTVWVGCDQYGPDMMGPDCDDADDTKADPADCECAETPPDTAADACAEGMAGKLGQIAEGGVVPPIKGTILGKDNGVGNGAEDWYWVEFPEAMAMGPRPNAGRITVSFAVNPGDPTNPDYRFEVYKTCGGKSFEGLAANFGMGAPPAREWTFFDQHMPPNPNPNPNPNYKNDVPWPAKVFIRVFRVNNDQVCSEYTLQVARQPN